MSARRSARTAHPSRSGMTLLETLLAISIAVLVLALVYSIYHTTVTVVDGQSARRGAEAAAADALESLARDLACALPVAGDDGCPFQLAAPGNARPPGSEMEFCTAVPPPGEKLRWFTARRLTVRLIEHDGRLALAREERDLAGPGAMAPAVTNLLALDVAEFRAEALLDGKWFDAWPPEESAAWPQAVRMEIAVHKGESTPRFTTEVFMPAGRTVTSRIERATAAGK